MPIERDPDKLKLWLAMDLITQKEYDQGYVTYDDYDQDPKDLILEQQYERHKKWLSTHPHKKFYNIPEVEGTKHLDVGWVEGDFPIIGATLGVDVGSEGAEPTVAFNRSIGFEEIAASGSDLPFADGTLDSVSSQHSMGYHGDYSLIEGLVESIRVLRSGGKLAVLIWEAPQEVKRIRKWLKHQPVRDVRMRIRAKDPDEGRILDDGETVEAHLYGIEFTRI